MTREVDNTAWKKKLTPQQKAEYKAEKREEMQNLFKKIDDGVKAVFESDSYKKCLRYMSKFTNYSAGNCILIMLQKPDASLVAAFGKWKELGRTINKGEKGIAILAPMSFKSKELKEQPVKDSSGNQVYNADGSEKKEKVEVEQTSIGFKKVYVFDVSQTSGEPIPEYVHELNEAVEDEQVEAVINAVHDITGLPVDFENIKSGAKGYYNYGEQRIVIQENLSGAQAIKTAIHECAHALLHDPDKKLPTVNTSRSDKEVQAESVAYIVASRYGIDTSDYSFPYIASWSQGKQLEQLNRFLNEIQETARTICDAIDAELQALSENQTEEQTEDECLGLAM
ncbi:ArdC-like ssDNA-binding domain-containing protein [Ruminococcus flavefaciens]|uniref:ArdC-like ssDNA-binding domain-containing protein n=1 Tax=Ruminococcus flavefaciens TaxID=1265 RepID=UPI001563FAA7|nr:ArdC-like ssDNA-binding domain-containing protein [Ruminococcus flavefaciens]